MKNFNTFLNPLPLSMLLLVTLKIITKSITTLIRGKGGKCVLTIRMSELTRYTANVSILLQLFGARFSFQLFKSYFSFSTASNLQEVLNSLNSLLEFNYISSFLFLGILKMFCICYCSRNLAQLRFLTLFTLSSVSCHGYLSI